MNWTLDGYNTTDRALPRLRFIILEALQLVRIPGRLVETAALVVFEKSRGGEQISTIVALIHFSIP
jgi:hypothetical protein